MQTIKKRLFIDYISIMGITILSLFLIFSIFSYSSYGKVPSVEKIYRILTTQRPLSEVEKDSFALMSNHVKKNSQLLELPFNKEVYNDIKSIEHKNLNVVIRKNSDFIYYSKGLIEQSLRVHSPKFEFNNLEPTGTLDNKGRFFHYIKMDFKYLDGSRGSFFILKRESNLFEFFIQWGVWVVLFILGISAIAFWYINKRLTKTVIRPLLTLEKNMKEIINEEVISPINVFKESAYSSREVNQLQKSFKKMWLNLREAQLKQTKYEENRKTLIANISHDLKTPITSIIGYIEGLKDGVARTEEKRAAYLNTIYEKSMLLNRLIDDLFLYSKLDFEGIQMNQVKTDFVHYIKDITKEIKWDERVELSFFFPNEKLYTLLDSVQFDRVIGNLIQNSLKFRNKKKEKLKIQIQVEKVNEQIVFSFADDGIGISSEDLEHIFERFYRADKSRTPMINGSGLGLSIVKQIIENHGGSIRGVSEMNQGVKIIITLPLVIKEVNK